MSSTPPEPALALFLLRQAAERGSLLALLRSAGRLERVGRFAAALADGVEVLLLPPWDVLPYDRAAPSPGVVGQRIATLSALARPATQPRLLLTSAEAALQRVRPLDAWRNADLELRSGESLDMDAFRAMLAERGYVWDERVDGPGEVALRGQVIDIFPAGAEEPARLELDEERVVRISGYDPVTLRSKEEVEQLVLRPAIEFPLDPNDLEDAEALLEPDADTAERPAELNLPRRLVPIFDLLPGAPTYRDPEVPERWQAAREAVDDAFAASAKAGRVTGRAAGLPRPNRLYVTLAEAEAGCGDPVDPGDLPGEELPPPRRIDDLLAAVRDAGGDRVVIAAPSDAHLVAASLRKRGLAAEEAVHWGETEPGKVAVVAANLRTGLRAPGLLLLPVGPLLRPRARAVLATGDEAPRIGETVVHLEHGVCRLTGLVTVEDEDRIALEFADGAELLIAARELDRVWRYGEGGGGLDRIGGEGWHRKREEIEAELSVTAQKLAEAASARAAAEAPAFRPPPERYSQVARRFPYPPSEDQRAAIHAVLQDLASGHPMDRLLCGDVGFGKTEVAIRAAAAVSMAGGQVAIAAPTTVLARQHLDVFRRRFAGTGVRVEGLIRAAATAENRALRTAIRNGEVGIVIGTQGLAGLRFRKLGLAVIDEEQRFGESDKRKLADMAPHILSMTATPIPRTMQAALVGLRDVSVLATPPQNRQATRTFVLPWDPVVVREALLRERRRGGQSFVVCPRIADIAALQARLAEIAAELDVIVAHGRMKPDALEAAVLGFAEGRGDVLLATNIIEAGLDIPHANLILVTQADRFGLAQLHQLRGRVGRGARRGTAYFLTEPGRRLTEATRRRLATMETLSGLGAGVAISAADLDLRGAGDLFGEAQAGHLRAVGTELYQHLLTEAVARQRGEPPPPPLPELRVELAGGLPESYVPEANLRISLLRRLARITDGAVLEEFAAELADRFGPLPDETLRLLTLQRLGVLCRAHNIVRVDAGPQASALTPADPKNAPGLAKAMGGGVKDGRVLLQLAARDPVARAASLITALGG